MSIRVAIIEDEQHAAKKLERQLLTADSEISVLVKLETVEQSIEWLKNNTVDLIFLDIHLGDALSFEIFRKIEIKTPVIFTTAYDQYAIQAFTVNSVDYLLKPVNKEALKKSIEKFRESRLTQQGIDYTKLMAALQPDNQEYQKRFMIHTGNKIKTIQVEEIAYFFAEGKYCYLYSIDGNEYLIDQTLDKLISLLDPDAFYRINRQFIISLTSIDEMYAYPKGRVKIILKPRNKKEAIVSFDRSPDFKKWLNR